MDNHNSKFSRFLAGKGFYAALAVCLIGTAAAAWAALESADPAVAEQSSLSGISHASVSSEAPVSTPASDIPVSSEAGPEAPVIAESTAPVTAPAETETIPVQTPQEDVIVVETIFPTQDSPAFVMPIEGEVFGVFSGGELVRNVTLGEWRTHDGIDIRAEKGSPVRAVADGVVSRVYQDPMWGTVVEITHADGFTSVTSGLDPAVAVSQGSSIRAEDTIGVVGDLLAEVSLDSHIHFGMKQDGSWVDPISAMEKAEQ